MPFRPNLPGPGPFMPFVERSGAASVLYFQALSVTSTFTPALKTRSTLHVTLKPTSTFTPALSVRTLHKVILKPASDVFAATLAKLTLHKVTLKPASSVFTPNIQKRITKTLKVTATFAPNLVKKVYVTLKPAVSSFGATLSERVTFKRTLKPPSSPFTPTLTPVFQAGGGGGSLLSRFLEWLDNKFT
jgi:hypothetical protein